MYALQNGEGEEIEEGIVLPRDTVCVVCFCEAGCESRGGLVWGKVVRLDVR